MEMYVLHSHNLTSSIELYKPCPSTQFSLCKESDALEMNLLHKPSFSVMLKAVHTSKTTLLHGEMQCMYFAALIRFLSQHPHLSYSFYQLLYSLYVEHLNAAYSHNLCPSYALLNGILRCNE